MRMSCPRCSSKVSPEDEACPSCGITAEALTRIQLGGQVLLKASDAELERLFDIELAPVPEELTSVQHRCGFSCYYGILCTESGMPIKNEVLLCAALVGAAVAVANACGLGR